MSSMHSARNTRVLVLVSDSSIRRAWTTELRDLGYIVSGTGDSVGAELLLGSFAPDVVVLDIDLPWRQYVGDPINAVLRRTHAWLIVATPSRSRVEHERLRDIGAHSVITMSTSPLTLLEAMTPLVGSKRDAAESEPSSIPISSTIVPITGQAQFGSLLLDTDQRVVMVDGKEVPLTRIEFDLLAELCRKPRGISLRSELLVSVWGQPSDGDVHIVDVHLSNMRRKLSAAKPGTRFVQTVRGMGFRLADALMQNAVPDGLRLAGTNGGGGGTIAPMTTSAHGNGNRNRNGVQAYIASNHHWPASTAAR